MTSQVKPGRWAESAGRHPDTYCLLVVGTLACQGLPEHSWEDVVEVGGMPHTSPEESETMWLNT